MTVVGNEQTGDTVVTHYYFSCRNEEEQRRIRLHNIYIRFLQYKQIQRDLYSVPVFVFGSLNGMYSVLLEHIWVASL
ncbi:hypothetical protein VIGAN_02167800 [Vigna angularis var. angularis]|uniref:Uncharacterized protein n=1 Tax=Vigna angularis var. angularis TaxID=157739 RepID=A0A0S3RES7_PHAAN|nr:hypothetical protein VIGAN_02167800 [Vigna angularis var. angularis]